ncbi:TerB N-terminal domain-containing protein [Paenibacillus algorifonticola]|uniref:TerB N-terminal domain-containing protein n=1 Tax=Paenibacillus algorifonticola TaxID=684063 RepID=UPI003D2A3E35
MSLLSLFFNKDMYELRLEFNPNQILILKASCNDQPVSIRKAIDELPRNDLPEYVKTSTSSLLFLALEDWLSIRNGLQELSGRSNPRKIKFYFDKKLRDLNVTEIIYDRPELVLEGYPVNRDGIGEVYGVPVVQFEETLISALELSQLLESDEIVLRLENGWVAAKQIKTLGIAPKGRMIDGTLIDPLYKLTPEEIIMQHTTQLQGSRKRLIIKELATHKSKEVSVLEHLLFLTKWGLSGGVFGGAIRFMHEIIAFLEQMTESAPLCRIMVIGKSNLLESIKLHWHNYRAVWLNGSQEDPTLPEKWSGIIFLTPKVLAQYQDMQAIAIDLLIMLEPDDMTKSNSTLVFRHLDELRTRIRISIFSDKGYMTQSETRAAQLALIHVDNSVIQNYTFLQPESEDRDIVDLKTEYEGFAEIEWTGKEDEIPIPKQVPVQVFASEQVPQVIHSTDSHQSSPTKFVKQAKKLEKFKEKSAEFVPFMTYYPTYESLTTGQRKWYFYWREEVRQQRYPNTDASYIFLYVYELINGIGWEEAFQGYNQLINVMYAYEKEFPKISYYLIDWIADFVTIHKLEQQLESELYAVAPFVSGKWLDRELFRLFKEEPLILPFEFISSLSNYNVKQSSFYNSGEDMLIQDYMPKIITLVDAFYKKKYKTTLFDKYNSGEPVEQEKPVFQGAIYDSSTFGSSIVVSMPYISSHEPLREFITQLMRETENVLRQQKGYKNKLRNIELPIDVIKLIQSYLERELGGKAVKLQDEIIVKIDAEKLAQLIQDSELVRQMLTTEEAEQVQGFALANMQTAATKTDEKENRIELVEAIAQDGELEEENEESRKVEVNISAEMGEDEQLLAERLEAIHLEVLDALIRGDSMLEVQRIAEKAGTMVELLLDEINDAAMDTIGDLIICDDEIVAEYLPIIKQLKR